MSRSKEKKMDIVKVLCLFFLLNLSKQVVAEKMLRNSVSGQVEKPPETLNMDADGSEKSVSMELINNLESWPSWPQSLSEGSKTTTNSSNKRTGDNNHHYSNSSIVNYVQRRISFFHRSNQQHNFGSEIKKELQSLDFPTTGSETFKFKREVDDRGIGAPGATVIGARLKFDATAATWQVANYAVNTHSNSTSPAIRRFRRRRSPGILDDYMPKLNFWKQSRSPSSHSSHLSHHLKKLGIGNRRKSHKGPGSVMTMTQRKFAMINRDLRNARRFQRSIGKDSVLTASVVLNPNGIRCKDVCDPEGPGFGLIGFCTGNYCKCDFEFWDFYEKNCPGGSVFDPVKLTCDTPSSTVLCADLPPAPRQEFEFGSHISHSNNHAVIERAPSPVPDSWSSSSVLQNSSPPRSPSDIMQKSSAYANYIPQSTNSIALNSNNFSSMMPSQSTFSSTFAHSNLNNNNNHLLYQASPSNQQQQLINHNSISTRNNWIDSNSNSFGFPSSSQGQANMNVMTTEAPIQYLPVTTYHPKIFDLSTLNSHSSQAQSSVNVNLNSPSFNPHHQNHNQNQQYSSSPQQMQVQTPLQQSNNHQFQYQQQQNNNNNYNFQNFDLNNQLQYQPQATNFQPQSIPNSNSHHQNFGHQSMMTNLRGMENLQNSPVVYQNQQSSQNSNNNFGLPVYPQSQTNSQGQGQGQISSNNFLYQQQQQQQQQQNLYLSHNNGNHNFGSTVASSRSEMKLANPSQTASRTANSNSDSDSSRSRFQPSRPFADNQQQHHHQSHWFGHSIRSKSNSDNFGNQNYPAKAAESSPSSSYFSPGEAQMPLAPAPAPPSYSVAGPAPPGSDFTEVIHHYYDEYPKYPSSHHQNQN